MLQIDQSDLIMAFYDMGDGFESYLDLKTGKIISYCLDYEEEEEINIKYVKNHPDEYCLIEQISFYDKLDWAKKFITHKITEQDIQNKLGEAFNQRKWFRRFRYLLEDFPNIRDRRFDYEHQKILEYVKEYLESNSIKSKLIW